MGGGGSSGPTVQQQQLEAEQAITNANLNLEENDQRKSILNAMQGTRVFRGSALSRALRGNRAGNSVQQQGAPSRTQLNVGSAPIGTGSAINSLLDQRESRASGATPSGGVGASAATSAANIGGYAGGASGRGVAKP